MPYYSKTGLIYTITINRTSAVNTTDWDGIYYYTFPTTVLGSSPLPYSCVNGTTSDGKTVTGILQRSSDGLIEVQTQGNWSTGTATITYSTFHGSEFGFYLTYSSGTGVTFAEYLDKTGQSLADNIDVQMVVSRKGTSDAPYYAGLKGATISSESASDRANRYPWMGVVQPKLYTVGGAGVDYLLAGTRPLFHSSELSDYPITPSSTNDLYAWLDSDYTYYLVYRTKDYISICSVNSITENNSYGYYYLNSPTELYRYSKSDFCEKVVPLRLFLTATGGGGGGYNGPANSYSSGGGAGGTAFGIWDFLQYPSMIIQIGKGGGKSARGGSTKVWGVTRDPLYDSTNNYFYFHTNFPRTLLIEAKGGGAGTSTSGGSGGDITNALTYKPYCSMTGINSSTSGAVGGAGGKVGTNGTALTFTTVAKHTLSANSSIDNKFTHLQSSGIAGVGTYGGGGGASFWGNGGAGLGGANANSRGEFGGGGGGSAGNSKGPGVGGDGLVVLMY